MKYLKELLIYPHYTNYRGQLFVKFLCDLFNEVAGEDTELKGIDVDTLNKEGKTWMMYRLRMSLDDLPYIKDKVTMETWASGVQGIFALRDFNLLAADKRILMKATTKWLFMDIVRRRPARLSPKIIDVTKDLPEELKSRDIKPLWDDNKLFDMEYDGFREFYGSFDNIDINGHVTQPTYIRWITNSLPFDFLKNHIVKELDIIHEHEIMPDKKVKALYKMESQGEFTRIYHKIKGFDDDVRHCIAITEWRKIF